MAKQAGGDMIRKRIAALTQGTDVSDTQSPAPEKPRLPPNNKQKEKAPVCPPDKPLVSPRQITDKQELKETKTTPRRLPPPPPIESKPKTKIQQPQIPGNPPSINISETKAPVCPPDKPLVPLRPSEKSDKQQLKETKTTPRCLPSPPPIESQPKTKNQQPQTPGSPPSINISKTNVVTEDEHQSPQFVGDQTSATASDIKPNTKSRPKTKNPPPPVQTRNPFISKTKVEAEDEHLSSHSVKDQTSATANDAQTNTNDDCIVTVTGFDKSVTEEALKLHFENRNKSGGGPVDSVSVIDGAAVVHFKHASDAQRVLKRRQLHERQFLTVVSFSESVINNMFVVFGMSESTTHELLKDFLESKTGHSVESIQELEKDLVLVTFPETSVPAYAELQRVFSDERMDGCTLSVSRYHLNTNLYDEPTDKHVLSTPYVKFKFIQKYELREVESHMELIPVIFTMDSVLCHIVLNGRACDVSQAVNFMNEKLSNLEVNEYNIIRPGVYTFLQTKDARELVSLHETEEGCTVLVQEDIYEPIEGMSGSDSTPSTDTDSNPSGGSYKGYLPPVTHQATNEHLKEGSQDNYDVYGVVSKSEAFGQFKIGRCQFQLKEGSADKEDSDCIVNITQSEIDQGDIWTYLADNLRDDLIRQFSLRVTEWSKKGIMVSTISGLPCKYIIHVSLRHFGGNLSKAINKCLQTANTMKGVASVSLFSKPIGQKVQDAASVFVDAIHRLQKTTRLAVVEVRLVLDTMTESFIARVQQEVEALKYKKRGGFWSGLPNPLKPKTPSGLPSTTAIPVTTEPMAVTSEEPEYSDGEQEYILDNDEAVFFICSHSEATNERVFHRLEELCDKHMPPKVTSDFRIGRLTKQQLKELRKSAGKRVELDVDAARCCIEMKGFSKDVNYVYSKLKYLLDAIPDTGPGDTQREAGQFPPTQKIGNTETDGKNEDVRPNNTETVQEDNDDIFGKLVANELREIADLREKGKAKLEIQKILYDAQQKCT